MRLMKRHLTKVLQRKLDSGTLTDEAAKQVRTVLCDDTGKALDALLVEARKLEGRQIACGKATTSDRPILDWLENNWSSILTAIAAILTILKML